MLKKSRSFFTKKRRSILGFTLIELLVVISILGVLTTVAVMILNPATLIDESKDSTRLKDMDLLNKVVGLAAVDNPAIINATPLKIYLSLPDSDPLCGGIYNLPELPPGWQFACGNENNFRKVDGSGWLPIDLNSLSTRSPISILPIDPENLAEKGMYYTFTVSSDNKWKLTAILISEKRAGLMASDGGTDPTVYESGSDLALANFDRGLISYFKLDGDYKDSSGYGNDGVLEIGSVPFSDGVLGKAGVFDGNAIISYSAGRYAGAPYHFQCGILTERATMSLWVNFDYTTGTDLGLVYRAFGESLYARMYFLTSSSGNFVTQFRQNHLPNPSPPDITNTSFANYRNRFGPNEWHLITAVFDNTKGVDLYFDARKVYSHIQPVNGYYSCSQKTEIGQSGPEVGHMRGMIDDLRIYKHALTPYQIKALYNAGRENL